jgi:hypothetical protein
MEKPGLGQDFACCLYYSVRVKDSGQEWGLFGCIDLLGGTKNETRKTRFVMENFVQGKLFRGPSTSRCALRSG